MIYGTIRIIFNFQELQNFLDKSKQGVIYFSLGSNMKTVYLSDATRNMLLDVFGKLPYNVLLKWEDGTLPGKPENVFTSKWVPQLTVLGKYLKRLNSDRPLLPRQNIIIILFYVNLSTKKWYII